MSSFSKIVFMILTIVSSAFKIRTFIKKCDILLKKLLLHFDLQFFFLWILIVTARQKIMVVSWGQGKYTPWWKFPLYFLYMLFNAPVIQRQKSSWRQQQHLAFIIVSAAKPPPPHRVPPSNYESTRCYTLYIIIMMVNHLNHHKREGDTTRTLYKEIIIRIIKL